MRIQQYFGAMCGVAAALTMATAPAWAAESPASQDLAFWVKSALIDDPHVSTAEIEVTCDKGVITLNGTAPNLATKQYAVQDAEKVNGVVGVIDEINLAPSSRPDFDIAQDVRHAIVNNQMIATSWITVTSTDGMVQLEGQVGSWAERQEAGIVASEVRGVRSVNNLLRVRYAGKRSDEQIQDDAEARLDLDIYLNGLPVTVAVTNGDVTLSGTVGSKFEMDRAEQAVRYLAGVKSVTNNLRIEPWENQGSRTTPVSMPSDSELAARVKSVLSRDSRVDAANINVNASEGHVALTGSVPFMYEKRLAGQDATHTVGAAWTTNDLDVVSVPREDESIADDILSNFSSDYLLNGLDITIRVRNGTVTLSGDADTAWERQHAEQVVARVPGVKDVQDDITVQRNHLSNTAVAKHIVDRLSQNWLTAAAQNDIDVRVKDGVATLSGEVGTWAERAEAAQTALRTPGIWSVHDRLTVRGVPYPWNGSNEEILVRLPDESIWP
jgi:osmotically-inducible protein OsmY